MDAGSKIKVDFSGTMLTLEKIETKMERSGNYVLKNLPDLAFFLSDYVAYRRQKLGF